MIILKILWLLKKLMEIFQYFIMIMINNKFIYLQNKKLFIINKMFNQKLKIV